MDKATDSYRIFLNATTGFVGLYKLSSMQLLSLFIFDDLLKPESDISDTDAKKIIAKISKLYKLLRVSAEQTCCSIVNSYLTYLSDCLREAFLANNRALYISDKSYKASDFIGAKDLSEIYSTITDDLVHNLNMKGFEDLIKT
ncbi:hypothetical protein ACI3L1_12840 [Deinococcus sp. SM5_A1]|uniref:hypothetical protein n=1 Tax=Deinococcus sp. SM5_A1 TaxID=3379094 RepID=UPI00385D3B8E